MNKKIKTLLVLSVPASILILQTIGVSNASLAGKDSYHNAPVTHTENHSYAGGDHNHSGNHSNWHSAHTP